MDRDEFGTKVRREARARSGGLCEAVGAVYGLEPGQRCNAPLVKVEFDHYPVRAADGGEATLENCAAVCPTCHKFKTAHFDIPQAAKGKRVSDRHLGIRPPSKFQSAGFSKPVPQRSATAPLKKRIGQFEETP